MRRPAGVNDAYSPSPLVRIVFSRLMSLLQNGEESALRADDGQPASRTPILHARNPSSSTGTTAYPMYQDPHIVFVPRSEFRLPSCFRRSVAGALLSCARPSFDVGLPARAIPALRAARLR